MGTRSTTKIYEIYTDDKGKETKELVLALYKQLDGYIESWGKELKEFIKSGKFVNRFGIDRKKQFNGIGCFALQLVSKFKEGMGGLYATTKDDEQEFNYTIELRDKDNKPYSLTIECKEDKSFNEIIKL